MWLKYKKLSDGMYTMLNCDTVLHFDGCKMTSGDSTCYSIIAITTKGTHTLCEFDNEESYMKMFDVITGLLSDQEDHPNVQDLSYIIDAFSGKPRNNFGLNYIKADK